MIETKAKGTFSRQIDETLERISKLIKERQELSERIKKLTDESKQTVPR